MTGAIDMLQLASPLVTLALIPIARLGDSDGRYAAPRSSLGWGLIFR